MPRVRTAALALLGGCALLAAIPLWPGAATVRAVGGVAVLSLCPGWALLRHARIDDPLELVVLAIAVSVALITVVAALLMYAGWWSPGRAIAIVALMTAAAGSVERRPGVGRVRGGRDVAR